MYVRDSRTLMGGIALILAGSILTSLLQLYFAGEYSGEGIVRSRWWWEIAMNLQVLGVACTWFCYVDRVSESEGSKKRVMQFRMVFGLLVVLLPFWVALLSAYLDWFGVRPPIEAIDMLICIMLGFWAVAIFLPRLMILKARPSGYEGATFFSLMKPKSWYAILPTYIIVLVWAFESYRGGTLHYQYVPFLLYLQAALPFVQKGIGWNKSAESTL